MEKAIFARLEETSRHINQTFKQLGVAIHAWLDGDEQQVSKSVAKISAHERKSRELKDEALKDVAQAISIYRSDFLRLVMKMGDAASYQGGAAVRLGKVQWKPEKKDPLVLKFKGLVKIFIEMGDALSNMMKKLGENMVQAQSYCEEIDLIEEKVDASYRSLESYFYSREDLDIRQIMQMREIVKHIEEACDAVQSTADSVRIILFTH